MEFRLVLFRSQSMREQREADEPGAGAELENPSHLAEQPRDDRDEVLPEVPAAAIELAPPTHFDVAIALLQILDHDAPVHAVIWRCGTDLAKREPLRAAPGASARQVPGKLP